MEDISTGTLVALVAFGILLIGLAIVWRNRNRSAGDIRALIPQVQQLSVRQRTNQKSGIQVSLIESSNGLQILDESDLSGNGVVTVYKNPEQPIRRSQCYSLVKSRAIIYNRRDYRQLNSDCVQKFSSIKDDFKNETARVVEVGRLPRSGFEGIMDYLKRVQMIKS